MVSKDIFFTPYTQNRGRNRVKMNNEKLSVTFNDIEKKIHVLKNQQSNAYVCVDKRCLYSL